MPRVFMLSHLPLFSAGVQTLLCREPGVEIVGLETDVERAIKAINVLKPDVVILDNDLQPGSLTPLALRLLEETQSKVIGLSLHSNTLYIYHKEKRVAHDIGDLMEAIKNNPPNEPPHSPAVQKRSREDKEAA